MFAPAYLDFNATAPLRAEVREAMLPYLGERFGNASSRHEYGRQARAAVENARTQVAGAIGAHASEVVFTSGGSEANNLFLKGAAALLKPGVVAVSAIEHPCVREPVRQLARQGWSPRTLQVDGAGRIELEDFEAALAQRPRLVSVMLANNETGVLQDIALLAQRARLAGAWFHTDAVQALGKVPVHFRKLGVNALTLSAHKIGGPLGAGALVADKRVELAPLVAGGGQERGLRSGTENVPAIVGFGVACELALRDLAAEQLRLAALRDEIEAGVLAMGARIYSQAAPRLPGTAFFSLPGFDGETLVAKLDRAGFAVASGSACSSANPEPSASLVAMGVDPELARGAVRVSLGYTTTRKQVGDFLATLTETVHALKNLAAVAV
jgi:cysteine desulfurase